MATDQTQFTGVYPAMPTPFDRDGSIDYDRVRQHIEFLEDAGVDGVVPAGSTGESATLSHDEHIDLIEFVTAETDLPVIAGTGSNATHEAISLSRRAADLGVEGLLLVSPYYNLPEPEGLRRHFEAVADEVDVPQIIYNVPGRTGMSIPAKTAGELAKHENIVGYKAASTDLEHISEVIERTQSETFSVLSGDDPVTLPIISIGGTGVISVAGNVIPGQVCELVDAALDDRYDRAQELHHELGPLFRMIFAETNPIPIKEAMAIRGMGEARFRLPLTNAAPEVRERLEQVLADLE